MDNLPFLIECADFFIASLLNEFPGAVVSMSFSIKPRPGLENMTVLDEPVYRGTWLIGIDRTCKNGQEINNEAYAISERIFYTHGVFIQHLVVGDETDES